jgi:phage terminase large subunit GpA-like protein
VHMEQWLVDRFEIKHSKRPGMGSEFAPIDPASHPEDWDVLTDKLLDATWKTPDPNREIKIRMLTVDSGGEDGVTHNAYAWYRRVRKAGHAHRVTLYKGASEPKAPIIRETMVSGRKGTKGDIPLLICNPNLLSDMVAAGLRRGTPGPGFYHFPQPKHPTLNPDGWLQQAFFDELEAEVRGKNGTWQKVRKRNESFDLCRMMMAGMLRMQLDKIKDWNVVQPWLAPLDKNSEIVAREDRRAAQENSVIAVAPAEEVRVLRPARRPRRHSVAQY